MNINELAKYLHVTPQQVQKLIDRDARAWGAYPEVVKGERADALLDSPAALTRVLFNSKGRVWIYVNWKIKWAIGPEMRRTIQDGFQPVFTDGEMMVLLSQPRGRSW